MNKNLVVDLDETLINSDILHETFWSAFSKDWKIPFKSIYWSLKGLANLKKELNKCSEINIKNLPYNKNVIEYIKKHRKNGGYTALVTASNHTIAEKIARYLNLFDEVKGSTENLNLIGESKANYLKKRFGFKKFDYIGDSIVDLHIWKIANKAIIVNTTPKINKSCEKINSNIHNLKSASNHNTLTSYLKTLRIYQWIKNVLIFIPMLTAHQITVQNSILSSWAFIAFCLIASSVYVINDLLDLNDDRSHYYKKYRPLALGSISIKYSLIVFLFLFTTGITISFFIGFNFFILMIIYYILTTSYSLIIKKKVIADIFVLGILYTIRIVAGSLATQIEISFWLFTFSLFFFLSLAAVKRQSELIELKKRKKSKILGRGYQVNDLSIINVIALSAGFISVLVAGLYVNSPNVTALYKMPWTLGVICLVLLYWLIKVIFDCNRGLINNDPILYAIKDNNSRLCFFSVIILIAINFI